MRVCIVAPAGPVRVRIVAPAGPVRVRIVAPAGPVRVCIVGWTVDAISPKAEGVALYCSVCYLSHLMWAVPSA